MSASTAYFPYEQKNLPAYWNKRRKSISSRIATRWLREALSIGILLLSLVSEVMPLVLFWNNHLPVWQMSLIMFGAWVAAWWMMWIIAMALLSTRSTC